MKLIKGRILAVASVAVLVVTLLLSSTMTSAAVKKVIDDPSQKLPEYADDEVIVKFKVNNSTTQNKILNQAGAEKVEEKFKNGSKLIKLKDGEDVKDVIDELKKNKSVQYVQPNYIYDVSATVNDELFTDQWALENTGKVVAGKEGVAGVDIGATKAWDITMGSPDVIVAVIDTGTDITHPDLAANIWTNPGEIPDNGIDDDNNGFIDDVHGWDFFNNDNTVLHYTSYDPEQMVDPKIISDIHGTHVSGIIAALANNNSVGVSGIAPNVKIMPIQIAHSQKGYARSSDAIKAIEYAKKMGAKIINASWGQYYDDLALKDAISKYNGVFVAAAGNQSLNTDATPHYPSAYDGSNIISVAAVNSKGELASFSNYGPKTVTVGAPGDLILNLFPVYYAFNPNEGKGFRVLPAPGEKDAYWYMSGTSMATPHVSGVAALLLSMDPKLTPAEIKNIISKSVVQLPLLQGKSATGGMVSAYRVLVAYKAPQIPTGIIATEGSQTIQLNWNANSEFDILGYNVYRDGVKINSEPIKETYFVDKEVLDKEVSYSVSAVDIFGHESEKSDPVTKSLTSSLVKVSLIANDKISVKDGDTLIFGGEVSNGATIFSAKLEQLDKDMQKIPDADIDVSNQIKVNSQTIEGNYTVSQFHRLAKAVRLNIIVNTSGSKNIGLSNVLKVDNSSLTVNITYNKILPVSSGKIIVMANFNKSVVGIPKIDIDQPGTIDVSGEEMVPTVDPKVWKYEYEVKSGEGYSDGKAMVSIHAKDEVGNDNSAATNNTFIVDTKRPIVTSTDPKDTSVIFPSNQKIKITFSEKVKINSNLIKVKGPDGNSYASGRIIGDNYVQITGGGSVSNVGIWLLHGKYTIMIDPNAVIDSAGNSLPEAFTYTFTTEQSDDNTPPVVESVSPADNSTNVDPNKVSIVVTFSEPIAPTYNNGVKVVNSKGESVWNTAMTIGNKYYIALSPEKIALNETYSIIIPANAFQDMNLNKNTKDYIFKFSTGTSDAEPPELVSTKPQDNQITDANYDILLNFNEPLKEGSAFDDIIIKDSEGKPVNIARKHISGKVVYIIPADHMGSSTTRTVIVPPNFVTDLAGNAWTPGYSFKYSMTDYKWPEVVGVQPATNSSNLPVDSIITITYNETIQADRDFEKIQLLDGSNNSLAINKKISENKLILTPASKLGYKTGYRVIIPSYALKDTSGTGNSIPFSSTYSFSTQDMPSDLAPVISYTRPANNAIDVPVELNPSINVFFKKNIQPGINYNKIEFKDQNGNKSILSNRIFLNNLLITPSGKYQYNTTYTLTIPAGAVKDENDISLEQDYVVKFKTKELDSITPTIVTTDPINNSTGIAVNKTFTIGFSEMVQASTEFANIILKDSNNNIINLAKTIYVDKLTITPTINLAYKTVYALTIPANAVKDITGNNLSAPKTLTFTTIPSTEDNLAPSVVSSNPRIGETEVFAFNPVIITFNKDIQAGSAYDTITVKKSDGSLASINKGISGTKLTLSPVTNFDYKSTYTVTIPTNSIRDSAGNNILTNYTTTFTTAEQDNTAPVILFTDPKDGGVARAGKTVTIYFGEAVQPDSAFEGIKLMDANNNPLTFTKTFNSYKNQVLLTASQSWGSGATYNVYVPARAVKDMSGNSLVSEYRFKFSSSDYRYPEIVSFDPSKEGTARVSVDKIITISYNEDIQQSNGMNIGTGYNFITLKNGSGVSIPITKSISGNKLIIAPNTKLDYNTSYTLDIPSYAVKDMVGNQNPWSDKLWFTTELAPVDASVVVSSTNPPNNATGVKVGTSSFINVYFNKNIQAGAAYDSITLKDGNNKLINISKRIFNEDLQRILITIADLLDYNTTYTLTIPANSIKDTAGNSIQSDYVTKFTTEAQSTTSPPLVTSTNPSSNAVNISVTEPTTITFTKDIRAGNAYPNITFKDSYGNVVEASKSISGNTLTLTPLNPLNYTTGYIISIPAYAVVDANGNSNSAYSFTFFTVIKQ